MAAFAPGRIPRPPGLEEASEGAGKGAGKQSQALQPASKSAARRTVAAAKDDSSGPDPWSQYKANDRDPWEAGGDPWSKKGESGSYAGSDPWDAGDPWSKSAGGDGYIKSNTRSLNGSRMLNSAMQQIREQPAPPPAPGKSNGSTKSAEAQEPTAKEDNRLEGEATAKIVVQLEDGSTDATPVTCWDDFKLSKEIMDGIFEMGFTKPSKIQGLALPIAMKGRNIIGQARNGSGKTAAFALAMLANVDVNKRAPQGLCVCPTRELTMQNHAVIQRLGKFTGLEFFLAVPQEQRAPRSKLRVRLRGPMVAAERADMSSWQVWALRGADAGQLLNGRGLTPEKSLSNSANSHISRQVQELREKLSASRLSLQAQEGHAQRTSSRRLARSRKAGSTLRESLQASPSTKATAATAATSPSETKRSTAASSCERPLSPRYEGQPMTEGIAVWRETQALNESLGASAEAHRPLRSFPAHSRAPAVGPPTSPARASPRRQPTLGDGLEPVTQPLAQQMPPWASTFGVYPGPLPTSPSASQPQLPPFAEAAMSRLTWLQAEKEALEGWLSNAGYLSVSDDSQVLSSPRLQAAQAAQEPTASTASTAHARHLLEGVKRPSSEERQPMEPERWVHGVHGPGTGQTPASSLEDGSPSTPSSARRKSSMHQSYNALTAERAAAQAKLEDDIRALGLESSPLPQSEGKVKDNLAIEHRDNAATASFGVARNSAPATALAALRAEALAQPQQTSWTAADTTAQLHEPRVTTTSAIRHQASSDTSPEVLPRSDRSHSASTRVAAQQLGEASAPLSSFRSSLPVSGTDMPMRSEALSSQASGVFRNNEASSPPTVLTNVLHLPDGDLLTRSRTQSSSPSWAQEPRSAAHSSSPSRMARAATSASLTPAVAVSPEGSMRSGPRHSSPSQLGSRPLYEEVASNSASTGSAGFRAKAPSFSWPGTDAAAFLTEELPAVTQRSSSPPGARARAGTEAAWAVSSPSRRRSPGMRTAGAEDSAEALESSSLHARARAATEAATAFLDGRTGLQGAVSSSSRQSSPSRAKDAAHVAFGEKAATVMAAAAESQQDEEEEQEDDEEYDSQGSESSASLSPEEEAAQRQQLELDLQELQARLPSQQRAASGKVRSIRVSEPVDLLALADQGGGLGRSDGQVDVRPMWRRTMTEPGIDSATQRRCDLEKCSTAEKTNFWVSAQVVVGTPGKLQDWMKKRIIDPNGFRIFVVDEADQMIDEEQSMGGQVLDIHRMLCKDQRKELQILFFSATWPDYVAKLAKSMVPRPNLIHVKKEDLTLTTITQTFMNVGTDDNKRNKLSELYSVMNVGQSIIFVNTRQTAFDLATFMKSSGHTVSLITGTQKGQLEVAERDKVMQEFRDLVTRVLISTDVLSRGIDVPSVTVVVNYDLPNGTEKMETYLHRIGRTGRFGKKGLAVNLASDRDRHRIDEIKRFYNCEMVELSGDVEEVEAMLKPILG
ncbi:ATP-dependent RNA helicase DBP5 [Symbiodinium microadriaticum]|uniref:RNA helicase n=1 Tax=Symbiodinium microadriaticum TaxID=2951 RepID=A0A1Q9E6Y5_SYMMI|nr:ATP-dependent RNA helicase DBP5 [Symbiodinium microadriaticum]